MSASIGLALRTTLVLLVLGVSLGQNSPNQIKRKGQEVNEVYEINNGDLNRVYPVDLQDGIDKEGLRSLHRENIENSEQKEDREFGIEMETNRRRNLRKHLISDEDEKDYVDLELKQHTKQPAIITDVDIKNDIDLGLKHHNKQKEAVTVTDDNVKDDIDLGLRHHRGQKGAITDADIKDDVDLGLQHHSEIEINTDDDDDVYDMKNDLDLALKHNEEQNEVITDDDIKNDADLGLKHHPNYKVPMTEEEIKSHLEMGPKQEEHETQERKSAIQQVMKLPRQNLLRRQQYISKRKIQKESQNQIQTITDSDIKNDIDLGIRHERNHKRKHMKPMTTIRALDLKNSTSRGKKSCHPTFAKPQIRRNFKRMFLKNKKMNFLAKKLDENEMLKEQSLSKGVNRDNICDQYDVDGCSIPFGLPFFFKELFTTSCYRHDICYGCGVKYGFDRKTCDYAFKDNMIKACVAEYGDGQDVMKDPAKRLVVNAVETLQRRFNDIVRQEMFPAMTPSNDKEKDLENFQNQARFVQRSVLKKWAELLRKELLLKKGFSRKVELTDLLYAKQFLHGKEDKSNELNYDINLTAGLCQDILYDANDELSRMVELSCKEVEFMSCHFFDYVYFLGVRIFAPWAYHNKPEFYCGEAFVPKCLPTKH